MLSSELKTIKTILGSVSTIGILGYGVEGRSSYDILRTLYPLAAFIVMDSNENISVSQLSNTTLCLGEEYLSKMNDCDIVLRSPGIKLHKKYDTRITSQSALFTEAVRDKIIGVTGTKGKSTTTTLIHHLLSKKYKTALVGNIGVPALESLKEGYDYYICEYSCHQLADQSISPKYAILLNLFPEHLDYYKNAVAYYDAKKNIYLHQVRSDTFYTSVDGLSQEAKIELNTNLKFGDATIKGTEECLIVNDMSLSYSKALHGSHNKLNQLYAVGVAAHLGLGNKAIQEALNNFRGLDHRLETVYEQNELRFINDSISTIPQSAIAAMNSYNDLKVSIIGGFDRGLDYTELIDYLNDKSELTVVLFGEVGQRIKGKLKSRVYYKKKFAEAVTFACELGLNNGTVLMSPAASSYDEFKSFVQRGNLYREIVSEYYK